MPGFRLLFTFAIVFAPNIRGAECSPVVVNRACTITIERDNPVSPQQIRAWPNAKITILVHKRPTETITFDAQYKDVDAQDPISAILTLAVPSLKSLVVSTSARTYGLAGPSPAEAIERELDRIYNEQESAGKQLDSLKSGLNQAGQHLLDARGKSAGAWTPASFAAWKSRQLCEITGPGSGADASCQPSGVAQQQPVTSRALNALDEAITAAVKRFNAIRQDLSADETRKIETAIDSLDANQKALAAKLKANGDSQATLLDAAQVLRKLNGESDQAKTYTSAVDDKNINSLGVNRMLTVALSAQDAFTKEKQALATVTAVWGATRFELSTGALFSMVPNRSFQAAQIIQGGQPVRDSSGKINTVLTETTTRPTVVPFGLAHFRLKEWVVGGRRVAALLTGGIGVNTNSSSADFAAGASVLYRSLVISPLFHFTRDQRLTNGLYAGEQLTSSPPALTTERYWVVKFGLAISYRIPIN